ncbi:YbdD/YjiX family protein [Nocardioides deserti]|uniref:YbdD/YjiX family protein n=1 Tax=Nocardioides deserti TaxID=1588644 RepID=A0ABR6UCT1_9ACTN|nr:YbdD/YjiX family protein [Nocardioides deserti]MBC2962080.1 YbdD/YjiX family protein [Nocardioides deserti]GGO70221.1 hypothetical protein GCM10012276_08270 [Nocardioides deserti]
MSAGPAVRVRRAVDGVRWYLKEVTGESRWEAYLARCGRDGVEPMTRREYERHRTDLREHNPQSRCC